MFFLYLFVYGALFLPAQKIQFYCNVVLVSKKKPLQHYFSATFYIIVAILHRYIYYHIILKKKYDLVQIERLLLRHGSIIRKIKPSVYMSV